MSRSRFAPSVGAFALAATPTLAILTSLMTARPAAAQATFYTTLTSFQSAAPTTVVRSTFESFSAGPVGNISDGGVSFSNNGGGTLYILDAAGGGSNPSPQSNTLTANGNERFDITFGATSPSAVGFDTYTNNSLAPVVSVYDGANALIGSFTLTQGPNTFGFFGVTSTVPIGRVLWSATNGNVQNTAIDNVRTAVGGAAAPEPGAFPLALLGASSLLVVVRRRTTLSVKAQ